MFAHPVVAAVSDRRRRSEIDATIYVALYSAYAPAPLPQRGEGKCILSFDVEFTMAESGPV
jgi:hypothetical protein